MPELVVVQGDIQLLGFPPFMEREYNSLHIFGNLIVYCYYFKRILLFPLIQFQNYFNEANISQFISKNSFSRCCRNCSYSCSNLFRLNLTTFRKITIELFVNKLYYVTQRVSKKYILVKITLVFLVVKTTICELQNDNLSNKQKYSEMLFKNISVWNGIVM